MSRTMRADIAVNIQAKNLCKKVMGYCIIWKNKMPMKFECANDDAQRPLKQPVLEQDILCPQTAEGPSE